MRRAWYWISQQGLSTQSFYKTSGRLLPFITAGFLVLFLYGLIAGLFFAPADYQQGDGFRIIYVHVPSAFAAMAIYFCMTICAVLTLVWRIKIASLCLTASTSLGAGFTFLALVTGSIWGKPMWGTWWIWDARLTSVLILFFIYGGLIALQSIIANKQHRDRAVSLMTLVGAINLPIIHYSVIWWSTLHQVATLSLFSESLIAPAMLRPLLAMIAAFMLFYGMIVCLRMRNTILVTDMKTEWVKKVLQ